MFKFLLNILSYSYVLENLQTSRSQNRAIKIPKLSVFHEATQQKLALKKFISKEENSDVS